MSFLIPLDYVFWIYAFLFFGVFIGFMKNKVSLVPQNYNYHSYFIPTRKKGK